MDKGIYTALSGGLAKAHEIEIIANNLANANTPGFKRDTTTFNEYLTQARRSDTTNLSDEIQRSVMIDGRPQNDKSFVEMDGIHTSFSQGSLKRTGSPLDVGLEGHGFLEVLTPAGVRYTRQGSFSLSPEGVLVTNNGYPVLARGQGVAPAQRLIRLGQGHVDISPNGDLKQDQGVVAQLSVVGFGDDRALEKVGSSYFKNTVVGNERPDTLTRVHQGFVENSNVNAVHEMTRLIEVTRAYESHMQAIKTYHEIDGRAVNDLGR